MLSSRNAVFGGGYGRVPDRSCEAGQGPKNASALRSFVDLGPSRRKRCLSLYSLHMLSASVDDRQVCFREYLTTGEGPSKPAKPFRSVSERITKHASMQLRGPVGCRLKDKSHKYHQCRLT